VLLERLGKETKLRVLSPIINSDALSYILIRECPAEHGGMHSLHTRDPLRLLRSALPPEVSS
jgi:hypothetical protein